jgi:hypothetical protein
MRQYHDYKRIIECNLNETMIQKVNTQTAKHSKVFSKQYSFYSPHLGALHDDITVSIQLQHHFVFNVLCGFEVILLT